ncbi:RNA polymerase sigma factor [Siminovitchia fortis]|uniref:RNA polymerase sigma factor n=1 Tax=Siminovitchia fortis TaxID=254758 RepID=UPI0011A4F2D9|nr:RNA polymerase sigma factor [Siminovitchia fortis]
MSLNREIRLDDGSSETIETLYELYREPLYKFVFRYTNDQQLSIDVVQDTFEKLLKNQRYSPEKGKFKTYLFQIAYNTMATKLKRRKRLWSLLPFVAPDRTTDISLEERLSVKEAVQQLPELQRAVVLLAYYHDLTQTETADILGIPVGTVKSRLHHAMKKLKDDLEVDGDEK